MNFKQLLLNKRNLAVIVSAAVCVLLISAGIIAAIVLGSDKENLSSGSSLDEQVNATSNLSSSQGNSSGESSSTVDEQENATSIISSSQGNSSSGSSSTVQNRNLSEKPTITVAAQVANGICVIGGKCAKGTEYVTITGDKANTVTVKPFSAGENDCFIAQVKYSARTTLKITAKQKGKEPSEAAVSTMYHNNLEENYMLRGEYTPVIGKDSQMHFYSALLSYTLSSNSITSDMRTKAYENISDIVSQADSVGAETIFLIIPSSAQIYPETVPDGFNKTTGSSLYEAFNKIATDCGAKVIYPLETMKSHRNDGEGYQIYQHTDSHWSAYGAYWGTYDLFDYISKRFPAAKPRTLTEMGFYTTALYGGDALFNFPKYIGFEDSYNKGVASNTKIKELTTLFSLKTPTSTLSKIYNSNVGLYLTEDNASAATVNNPNGAGLPDALIMRDSFGKVSYDLMSDRFSTVYWGEFDNYNLPTEKIKMKQPDYVIYLYSERNLLKIMLNNSYASLLTLK